MSERSEEASFPQKDGNLAPKAEKPAEKKWPIPTLDLATQRTKEMAKFLKASKIIRPQGNDAELE